MRRLVVSFIITIGNYDYAFYWYLYLDGTIEAEVKATGIMLTQGLRGERHGVRRRGRARPGALRTTSTSSAFGSTWRSTARATRYTRSTPRPSARRARTRTATHSARSRRGSSASPRLTAAVDPFSGRHWMVVNDSVHNSLGQPAAYRLLARADHVPVRSRGL